MNREQAMAINKTLSELSTKMFDAAMVGDFKAVNSVARLIRIRVVSAEIDEIKAKENFNEKRFKELNQEFMELSKYISTEGVI